MKLSMSARADGMGDLPYYCQLAMHPQRITLLVLSLVFGIEAGIMLTLPARLESWFGPIGAAAADSLLLTVLLVPCLWGVIVVPLRRIADCRQHLVNWALASEERKAGELSRDLHDGVGQLVAALNIGLKSLESSSAEPHVVAHAQRLRDIGRQLHESLRVLARGLRPRALDDLGLAAAVQNFASEVAAQFATPVSVRVADLEALRLPEAAETALFRIVQEAVLNAVRHGRPQHIDIEARIADDAVQLSVQDDGQGFDPEVVFTCRGQNEAPFGLISMRERARLLGGSAQIASAPGRGTQLSVRIPLTTRPAAHEA